MSLLLFCGVIGCAAPGEPSPRRLPVPEAISDLAAHQAGDAVVLTFTLPRNTIEHKPLAEPPEVEIYRGSVAAGAAPGKLTTRLVYTIPAALVDTYLTEGHVRFVDPLKPEELARNPGGQMVYMVRTRASKRRASADSNTVAVRVYPVPAPISDAKATLTESAIELSWTPPERSSGGAALPALGGYRVYRAEVEPRTAAVIGQIPQLKVEPPPSFELIGVSPTTSFRDTQFAFGRAYLYVVRSVAQYAADQVESADSQPVVVLARDTFAPATPQGLVAVLVPATPDTPAHLELSWNISPEADLAGYHVYRSEQRGTEVSPMERLTREWLLTPTFRDISVEPGRRYLYRVSAVDRAGNESPLSITVSAEVPQREP